MPKRMKARGLIPLAAIGYVGTPARPGCELVYTVEGAGEFPFDMLRYDRATPSTEDSARTAQRYGAGRRCVEVRARSCTPKRWESFTWRVVDMIQEVETI